MPRASRSSGAAASRRSPSRTRTTTRAWWSGRAGSTARLAELVRRAGAPRRWPRAGRAEGGAVVDDESWGAAWWPEWADAEDRRLRPRPAGWLSGAPGAPPRLDDEAGPAAVLPGGCRGRFGPGISDLD